MHTMKVLIVQSSVLISIVIDSHTKMLIPYVYADCKLMATHLAFVMLYLLYQSGILAFTNLLSELY